MASFRRRNDSRSAASNSSELSGNQIYQELARQIIFVW
jgi:hypothetical protein